MQEQIDKVHKIAAQTASDVKEIKDALLGNDYVDSGLIERVKAVENYQNKDRKQKWMIIGGVSVLAILKEMKEEIINFFTI